ncbi:MAG: hypothetical protein AAF533_11870 [Acidobacteriota bacterium]
MSTAPPPVPTAPPPMPEEGNERSCLKVGCCACGALLLLAVLLVGGGAWSMYSKVKGYTQEAPMELPLIQVDDAQREEVRQRWAAYQQSAQAGDAAEIELTSDEINMLISDSEQLSGKMHVEIVDDVFNVDCSVPLDEVPGFGGRYFNGRVGFEASTPSPGDLELTLVSLDIPGIDVPPEFISEMRKQDLVGQMRAQDPNLRDALDKIEELVVADGKVRLVLNSN